jgi:hypothetical protein
MGFGKWMWATLVLVTGTALLAQYDERLAYSFVAVTLLAMLFRYPSASDEMNKIISSISGR